MPQTFEVEHFFETHTDGLFGVLVNILHVEGGFKDFLKQINGVLAGDVFHGFGLHELAAQGVDDLALLVHDIIVFEKLLAYFEVMSFHAGL